MTYEKAIHNLKMKKLRKAKGYTQAQLAQQVGVSRQTICEIERGRNKPSVKLAKRLGEVLNVNWYELYD